MPRYNLIDEPWLTLRRLDGSLAEVGLLQALTQAHEHAAVVESSPPNLVAIHRLLLAIASRALSREGVSWQAARWWERGLPADVIQAYLERWRDRFFVFHDAHPFMQVAALAQAQETREQRKPWTQLALDRASGNVPLVFDKTQDSTPPTAAAGLVMRNLLGFLQFTPGGLIKVFKTSDTAGPLANTAAILPLGRSLAQTLLLALRRSQSDDLPAWEAAPPGIDQLQGPARLAAGRCDRYTRQTRAVLLYPEEDGRSVHWIRFGAGLGLEDNPHVPEPMAAYRQGKTARIRVTFREGRAMWRDLPALVPDPGDQSLHPPVLNDASSRLEEVDAPSESLPLLVAGMASDQAKLLRWRTESVQLPRRVLQVPGAAMTLRNLFAQAEETGGRLAKLASALLWEAFPMAAANKGFRGSLPMLPTFYAGMEQNVPALLEHLARQDEEEAYDLWSAAQIAAAQRGWRTTCTALGHSLPAIRAVAKLEPRFHSLLRDLRNKTASTTPEEVTAT